MSYGGFAPTFDLMDGKVSENERRPNPMQSALMRLAIARKNSMHPAKNEGWYTQGNNSDSEAEGAPTTVAPGTTPSQN